MTDTASVISTITGGSNTGWAILGGIALVVVPLSWLRFGTEWGNSWGKKVVKK